MHTGFWYGKRQIRRLRRRWEVNIKMVLKEIAWVGVNWNDLAQDTNKWRALANAVMNFIFHKMLGISILAENLLAS